MDTSYVAPLKMYVPMVLTGLIYGRMSSLVTNFIEMSA
jgi:hypothetical protein